MTLIFVILVDKHPYNVVIRPGPNISLNLPIIQIIIILHISMYTIIQEYKKGDKMQMKYEYRKSGNFRCKNIFVVDGGYEN